MTEFRSAWGLRARTATRVFAAVAVASSVLITASCATETESQERPSATSESAAVTPTASPTPSATEVADPAALVEQAASTRCDAQGHAAYPLEFVPQRESATPQGAWEGSSYRLSYAAAVALPGSTPDAPPLRQIVQVRCALQYKDAKVVVVDWSAT